MTQTKFRVLLVENIHPIAKAELEQAGYEVDLLTYAPDENELISLIPKYSAIGIFCSAFCVRL